MVTNFRTIKNRGSWSHGGGLEQIYAEGLLSQSHFYGGKPLRRAPLRAISGSSVHPILVLSVLLGSRDLVEKEKISL